MSFALLILDNDNQGKYSVVHFLYNVTLCYWIWGILHWETAVTKKSVVFVPLYTLCGKVQNCTEGLQVMCIVTKIIFVTFYHLITNNRFVTMHKL